MTETQTKFLNLGEITDALADLPESMVAFVMMGGELLNPDGVDTYRGKNADLAIEPVGPTQKRTVRDLLGCLRGADGRVYDGYAGGKYRMHRGTAVCVSRYSDYSDDYVTSVEVRSGAAVVVTEKATR